MLSGESLEKINQLVTEVTEREGCFVYDIEIAGRTLRIFIDKESGIGIDDCANVSRGLNEILDADEEIIPGGAYSLEVSSPGLERPLRKPWHFEKSVGRKVWIKARATLESMGLTNPKLKSAKQVTASLVSVDSSGVMIKVEDEKTAEEIKVPFENIEKANVVFEVESGTKVNSKTNTKSKIKGH